VVEAFLRLPAEAPVLTPDAPPAEVVAPEAQQAV
jgi:hypothetical protein